MNKYITSALLIFFLLSACHSVEKEQINNATNPEQAPPSKTMQEGDIIFQTSTSNQSEAIQFATKSKYSHVGIIYKKADELYVYEAIQPVKITPLRTWINRGLNRHYVVKRLKEEPNGLTISNIEAMKTVGQQYLGKDYDLKFEWSNDKIYCSELVWKIYKEAFNIEIGSLEKISDFDLDNPIVQTKLKERYGNDIPYNESVITPHNIFQSPKLFTVSEQ